MGGKEREVLNVRSFYSFTSSFERKKKTWWDFFSPIFFVVVWVEFRDGCKGNGVGGE